MKRSWIFLLAFFLITLQELRGQQIAFQRYYPPLDHSWVFPEADGTFTLIGMSALSSAAGPSDVIYVKLDSAGNALFYRRINGGYYDDLQFAKREGNHFLLTGDNGTNYLDRVGMYVLELDSSGFVVFDGLYQTDSAGIFPEVGFNVCKNEYGGYTVLGYTWNMGAGATDLYLVKTDSLGEPIWGKTYGGIRDEGSFWVPFERTSDNGYIFGIGTNSFDSLNYDMLIIKTDSAGNIQWQKLLGDTGFDQPKFIHQRADGGYVIIGLSNSYNYSFGNAICVHLDSAGNVVQAKTIGTKSWVWQAQTTPDGGYSITGYHNLQAAVMILDSALNFTYVSQYPMLPYIFNAQPTIDGGLVMASASTYGQWQFNPATHLIRTLPDGRSGCDQVDTVPSFVIVNMPSTPANVSIDSGVYRKPVQFGTYPYSWPEFSVCYCNVSAEFSDSTVGHMVYFNNESSGASSYEWHFGTSAYSFYENPSIYYFDPGTYYVTLIVSDGICTDTVVHPVAIAAPPPPPVVHFDVYPSPASGPLTLNYYVDSLQSPVFRLYDVAGRLVMDEILSPGPQTQTFSIEFLAQGTYYWQVISYGEQTWTGKILKIGE